MSTKYNTCKNILLIIPSIRLGGGAEKVIVILANALLKRDYNVKILTFYDVEIRYLFKGEEICLKERITNSFFYKIFKLINRAFKIRKYCRKHKIDVVISFMEYANFSAILSKYLGNKSKIISSVRINPSIKLEQFPYNILMKLLYKKVDRLISMSKKSELILNENLLLDNIDTIYNPVLKNNIKFNESIMDKDIMKIFHDSFVFISIGRLSKQKNHLSLIKAFKKVSEENSNARLLILGEGKLRKYIENLINELNLKDKVILLGNKENVFPYLRKANCFVFSSLYEGMPNALLEACNFDMLIISTDCETGPREILAPELKVDKKITYPYYARYGILTKPFVEKESNVEEIKMLSELMLEVMKSKDKYKTDRSENMKRFELCNIIEQWESVINNK